MAKQFDVRKFDVARFDSILSKGLSSGLGTRGEQVCIEAAICQVLDLPHGDDPGCVALAVRSFKIALNDCNWSSPEARAKGLRDLGLAQLGSLGVVDDAEFVVRLSKKVISVLIPKLFRAVLADYPKCLEAADLCEKEGSESAAWAAEAAAGDAARAAARAAAGAAARAAAGDAARAAWAAGGAAARAADRAAWAAGAAAWAAGAAEAADRAARAAAWGEYLILAANLALETLREMDSPGIALL
jgi:hypothetical protein